MGPQSTPNAERGMRMGVLRYGWTARQKMTARWSDTQTHILKTLSQLGCHTSRVSVRHYTLLGATPPVSPAQHPPPPPRCQGHTQQQKQDKQGT